MRRAFSYHHRMSTVPLFITIQILSALLPWLPCLSVPSQAQTLPITPSGLNTLVSDPILVGETTQYDITGGTRPGGGANLFHSFGDFNVPLNNIANFLNDTGLPTSNILARISGSNGNTPTLSSIYGTIQTTGFENANLFLINPAGFLFGPNATLNVGGVVAFTSADYLKLTDNARFNAIPNAAADALLTALPVASFGFLGSNPGAITIQGSQFSVTNGQSISLVGGNIPIESGTPDDGTAQPARLSAPNGNILLASAASPGEFAAATLQPLPNVDGATFTSYGSIALIAGSSINVSGGSTVSIRGGQFILSVNNAVLSTAETAGSPETVSLNLRSSIIGTTTAVNGGGVIEITADKLAMDGAAIKSTTIGPGHGMDIAVIANQLELSGGAQIASNAGGTGAGGDINVSVSKSVSISGYDTEGTLPGVVTFFVDPNSGLPLVTSGVFSSASGSGNGGHISVFRPSDSTQAPTIALDHAGHIATLTSGEGRGGDITLNNISSLTLENGAQLFSSSGVDWANNAFSGTGPGGHISVTASDQVRVSGGNLDLFALTKISSQSSGIGDNGHITLHAPSISFEEGGTLVSSKSVSGSDSPGLHGNISLISDALTISGAFDFEGELIPSGIQTIAIGPLSQTLGINTPLTGGNISVSSAYVSVDQGFIRSTHQRLATGGNLVFDVGDLNVTNAGSISAQGDGSLPTGRVLVTSTRSVVVSGEVDGMRSVIENVAGGLGHGSDISISAHEVLVSNGGRINSETRGLDGLNISISAEESVIVSNGGKIRIGVGDFDGGALHISAPSILLDQGILQTSTVGTGNAGSVGLTADHVMLTGGQIRSETEQTTGTGGNITIRASETISVSGQFSGSDADAPGPAGIFARSFNSGGNAGNASLEAPIITLSGGGQINSSTSSAGLGGLITVNATDQVTMAGGASISASSTGIGNAGDISIDAGNQLILQNSSITTEAAQASGGKIDLRALDLVQLVNSTVSTSVFDGEGGGGDIDIQVIEQLRLVNSIISTSVLGGTGSGGNIRIDPNIVVLQNSKILAQAIQGAGGNISITTPLFLADSSSFVSASSQFGLNGTVTIQSPTSNLSGSLGTLASKTQQAQSLVTQRCAALANGQASSFVVAGREQLPADPGGWLTSPLYATGVGEGQGVRGKGLEGLSTNEGREADTQILSLRRLTPAGFLIANFADSKATGCHS